MDLWYHTPVRQATLLGELISADPALVTAVWRGTKAPLTAMTAAMWAAMFTSKLAAGTYS